MIDFKDFAAVVEENIAMLKRMNALIDDGTTRYSETTIVSGRRDITERCKVANDEAISVYEEILADVRAKIVSPPQY